MICRYVKTTFFAAESGYTVAVYATKETLPKGAENGKHVLLGKRCFTAVGQYLPTTDAVETDLEGEWRLGKYGLQFHVASHRELLPSTTEGIERYLSSGLLKGIGPSTAAKIVAAYGDKTFEVLDKTPEKLLDIPGITPDRLKAALESYEQSRSIRDIVAFLTPFGVSPNKAIRIYDAYGAASLEKVKANPYILTGVRGFGFKTADVIARNLSFQPNAPMRLKEGALFTLDDVCGAGGHLFLPLETLLKKSVALLNEGYSDKPVAETEVRQAVYELLMEGKIKLDEGRVYTMESYKAETMTANAVARLLNRSSETVNIEGQISTLEKNWGITLSLQQRQAIRQAFTYGFSILTGGPGTGKTTILRFITAIYKKLHPRKSILQIAPTALAARRMSESTGIPGASTIHSALMLGIEWSGETSKRDLEEDFIIVDESSMIDQRLAKELFTRISSHSKVLMVGDADQLPSIGPGNVLQDLIRCGVVPTTMLDTIFRQAGESRIITNAHAINEGRKNLDFSHGDFSLVECETAEDAARLVVREYEKAMIDDPEKNVQVLSPFRQHSAAGSESLNETLREIMNPSRPGKAEARVMGRVFREGDRVMQTRNKKQVSNGDIGRISHISVSENGDIQVFVEFSENRSRLYKQSDLEDLTLAYAVTIHKSQGNEWNTVIIPVIMPFYRMLRRNLIYTAVTRARGSVVLVGNKKAIYTAISKCDDSARNTALGDRVRQAMAVPDEEGLKKAG